MKKKLFFYMSFFVVGFLFVFFKGKKKADKITTESQQNNGIFKLLGPSLYDSIVEQKPMTSEKNLKLRYFSEDEFGGWFDRIRPDLLIKLDEFRHRWGFPVEISKHPDAVGREDAASQSQHNIIKWGEVLAVDVFPKNSIGAYINSKAELKRAHKIALELGFNGIGLYTDTSPGFMIHLDVRESKLAQWSRIKGEYKGIKEAMS